jgi:hypothetical protein
MCCEGLRHKALRAFAKTAQGKCARDEWACVTVLIERKLTMTGGHQISENRFHGLFTKKVTL